MIDDAVAESTDADKITEEIRDVGKGSSLMEKIKMLKRGKQQLTC